MEMPDEFSPEVIEGMLGVMTLMAVDFGYISRQQAELLFIHGMIEVQEEEVTAVSGTETIEIFTLSQDACDYVMRAKKELPDDLGGASFTREFGKPPKYGKKKWVVSQSYLRTWRTSGKRVLPKSIIRRWKPSISI